MKHPFQAGYREVEHTADWELEVWGPNLHVLFEQAALGMSDLAHIQVATRPRLQRRLDLTENDPESLLVMFLTELLYISEDEGVAFDRVNAQLNGTQLTVDLEGGPIVSQSKAIKAVTFHNLNIRKTTGGYLVNIVFDV